MAAEVGVAYVSIVPTTNKFGPALNRQMSTPITSAGRDSGKRFGGAFGIGLKTIGGTLLAGAGIGAFVKGTAGAEASFSQTMNTLAAVTKTPQAQIKLLSDLALKFGRDTIFSAGEAATAMLELAKGGITTAQIRGGALSETLTLAAASGEDLATSATILSNAMNTFGLTAKDAPKITAALAGGANASTASIGSLGEALQQVGPGAKNAGLTIQDTVSALAAFDNAGIKGSDAGTSLKTMLARLVPPTKKAAKAQRKFGLSFTKANGQFISFPKIAGRLQKAFKGLSQEQRSQALTQIFGSDASRAASVLADEGTKGIQGYIKATKDQGAAQRIAAARMAGTAGAVETLKGSFETAKLTIGQAIAPAVQSGAGLATKALNGLAEQIPGWVAKIKNPAGAFQTEILPRLRAFRTFVIDRLGPALADFGKTVLPALRDSFKSIAKSVGSVKSAFFDGEGNATNFGNVLITVIPAAAQAVAVWFRVIAFNVRIAAGLFKLLTANIRFFATVGAALLGAFAGKILSVFGFIISAAAKAFGWVPGLGPKLKTAAAKFAIFKTAVEAKLAGFGKLGFDIGTDFVNNLVAAIRGGNKKVSLAVATGTANKLRAGLVAQGAEVRSRSAGESPLTINVNNPTPEPASESVAKAIRRKKHRQGVSPT